MKRLEFVTLCLLAFNWIFCVSRALWLMFTELGIVAPFAWLMFGFIATFCIVGFYLLGLLVRQLFLVAKKAE